MTTYIGVDFHPHQQTVCWCDTTEGVLIFQTLFHNKDELRAFYQQFHGDVIIGLEASGALRWFEHLLCELGHQVKVGDAARIRTRATSRHKSDRRDAELRCDLLRRAEFPTLWRRTPESELILEQLRFRHTLVQQRTTLANRIQALAHHLGLPKQAAAAPRMRHRLFAAPALLPPQRAELTTLYELFDTLARKIKAVEQWL